MLNSGNGSAATYWARFEAILLEALCVSQVPLEEVKKNSAGLVRANKVLRKLKSPEYGSDVDRLRGLCNRPADFGSYWKELCSGSAAPLVQ